MQYSRQLALTLISLVLLALFFGIDAYNTWFTEKVMRAIKDIPDQLTYMEIEERKQLRWGPPYTVSKNVLDYLEKSGADSNALVMLPPRELTKQANINYMTPEPVVFYYYTGLRSKWANMPGADSCNFAVIARGSNIELGSVDSMQLQAILTEYRKYKISL